MVGGSHPLNLEINTCNFFLFDTFQVQSLSHRFKKAEEKAVAYKFQLSGCFSLFMKLC